MMNPAIPAVYAIKFRGRGWARLWYGRAGENGMFVVRDQHAPATPFRVNLSSSFIFDRVNRLPTLQRDFAQGRPLAGTATWRGPETGEVFSWGPALGSLAYTGTPYDYDRNGPLTTAGNGNGNPATAYAPYAFFRTGTTADHAVTVSKGVGETRVSVGAAGKTSSSSCPARPCTATTSSARLGTRLFRQLSLDYSLALSETGARC
jgi:hypothetical protein